MERRYANSPIAEVLCQFRFDADPMDWTVPGLLYGELRDLYPQKTSQIHLTPAGAQQSGEAPISGETAQLRLRFTGEGEAPAWLIQVEPDVLVVNYVPQEGAPYPGWEAFRARVSGLVHTFNDISNAGAITDVALRYINRFDVELPASDEQPLRIGDYLATGPSFQGEVLPSRPLKFAYRSTLPFVDPLGTLTLQTGTTDPHTGAADTRIGLMLDIEFASEPPEVMHLDEVEEWLDAAHREVGAAFEDSITNLTRTRFDVLEGE